MRKTRPAPKTKRTRKVPTVTLSIKDGVVYRCSGARAARIKLVVINHDLAQIGLASREVFQ